MGARHMQHLAEKGTGTGCKSVFRWNCREFGRAAEVRMLSDLRLCPRIDKNLHNTRVPSTDYKKCS